LDGNEMNLMRDWLKMESPSVSMEEGKRTEWRLSVHEKAPRSMKVICALRVKIKDFSWEEKNEYFPIFRRDAGMSIRWMDSLDLSSRS